MQKAPHPVRRAPAHLGLHAVVRVRIARDDAHPRHVQRLGQMRLHLRQAVELAGEFLHRRQCIHTAGGERHARRIKADEAALLQGTGRRADFPLRQPQLCRQLPTAHRRHRAHALQHQSPQRQLLQQVGRKRLHQLHESVLHPQRLLAGMICPSGDRPSLLYYHVLL